MWRPIIKTLCYGSPRSTALLYITHRGKASCRLYTTSPFIVSQASLLYRNHGLRKSNLVFVSLAQPCCVHGYCSLSDDTDKTTTQNKDEPEKKGDKLSDEELKAKKKKLFVEFVKKQIKMKQNKEFYHFTENNYMGVADAKKDYLLNDSDIAGVRTFRRVSPYDGDSEHSGISFIDVALTKDLVKVAVRKWGSMENIASEKRRREYFLSSSPYGRVRIQSWSKSFKEAFTKENGLVIMMALVMNVVNACFKVVILNMTGSNAVFSELVHSGADILNQMALAVAKFLSLKSPDIDHPYGYGNFKPIMSIFCGIMFFSMGFGVSAYSAFQGFMNPASLTPGSFYTAVSLLSVTFITEAISLSVAVRQIRKEAKQNGLSFYQYVKQAEDPLVNVVLLEDMVGVLGVLVCGCAIGASVFFNMPVLDAMGSLTIGMMMAGVSVILFKTSTDILLGKSLWYEDKVKQAIQNDRMVNAVFDNKTIDLGDQSRLKSEVVIDAREIVRHMLDKSDIDDVFMKWNSVMTTEQMELFLEDFGEQMYDEMVQQIDRIEREIKTKFPEIRHIDFEPT